MPLPFIMLFSASLALQWQRHWLEYLLTPPRSIRVGAVILNFDDFKPKPIGNPDV